MKRMGWKYAALVLGLVLLVLLVMDFNNRTADLHRLTADSQDVEVRLNNQLATKAAIQTQIAYVTSEPAVLQWAYEDGKMVRPGDHPVIPLAASFSTPVPTPTPTPTPVTTKNWQTWLELFFGSSSP